MKVTGMTILAGNFYFTTPAAAQHFKIETVVSIEAGDDFWRFNEF